MSDEEKIKVIQVGIGGYGGWYLGHLFLAKDFEGERNWEFVAGVDPRPESSNHYQSMLDQGIPVYADLSEALEKHSADLIIICTPIHTHLPLTKLALESGANVLLEKPLCGSVAEADALQEAEDAVDGFVAIGFQWHYAQATQDLLADIRAGVLGKLQSVKTVALWPRNHTYYGRAGWAGARQTPDGIPVFDSPAMNACSHYLYYQLLIIGGGEAASAELSDARLMRANDIENNDTTAIAYKSGDVDGLFITSHSIEKRTGPHGEYVFENATITLDEAQCLRAEFNNGETKTYGVPEAGRQKIEACFDQIRGKESIQCRIADARKHIELIEQLKDVPITEAPSDRVEKNEEATWVSGLYDELLAAYEQGELPDF